MKFRAYADNVVIEFLPEPTETASGLAIVQRAPDARQARRARVHYAGPGHYKRINLREARAFNGLVDERYRWVPTEVKPGDVVLVDAIAGADFAFDIDVPRYNKPANFDEIADVRGEFRIVREDEIHGVLEEGDYYEDRMVRIAAEALDSITGVRLLP